MFRLTRLVLVALLLGLLCPKAAHARGDGATEVERLNAEARVAYGAADYARAVELFEKAYQIRQVANLLYNAAKAYEKLGDLEKAAAMYHRYLDSTDSDPPLRAKAEARLKVIETKHNTEEHVEKHEPTSEEIAAVEAQAREKKQQAEIAAVHKVRRRDRFIALGLGVGAVAMAAAAIGLSVSALSLHDQFARTNVESDKRSFKASSQARALAADVLYGVGAATAGVAAYFVFRGFHREKPKQVTFAPLASPTLAGLSIEGQF